MTDSGSKTSHAVIVARSMKVPAVVGVRDLTARAKDGDWAIVDGYDGVVMEFGDGSQEVVVFDQTAVKSASGNRGSFSANEDDIRFMIEGLTDGTISDGQVAAFAMAVFFRGMKRVEVAALTKAMADSGRRLTWKLPGPVVDKHSTGGVGDNVSLMLAPMVAACGGYVPMISGRGLGHTGGTLDKLDSIPGYVSQPDIALFRKAVFETGAAIIGQTSDLAPADRKLYAIRDVTATVESIPLITASILSKKLAAGLQGLVMDVKNSF